MGLYTIAASKGVSPEGKVYSFEPEVGTNRVLGEKTKKLGLDNVTIYPFALSDKKGKQKLFIDDVNVGGHSFLKDSVYKGESFLEVETTTLDEFFKELGLLDKIDVIKMDIEGAEGLVCKGGRELLEKSKPEILMEFNPSSINQWGISPADLLQLFVDFGYKINVVDKINKKTTKSGINDVFKIIEDHKHEYVNILLTQKDL